MYYGRRYFPSVVQSNRLFSPFVTDCRDALLLVNCDKNASLDSTASKPRIAYIPVHINVNIKFNVVRNARPALGDGIVMTVSCLNPFSRNLTP